MRRNGVPAGIADPVISCCVRPLRALRRSSAAPPDPALGACTEH